MERRCVRLWQLKSLWDVILKVVIAVASAVAGVLGGNAMNL